MQKKKREIVLVSETTKRENRHEILFFQKNSESRKIFYRNTKYSYLDRKVFGEGPVCSPGFSRILTLQILRDLSWQGRSIPSEQEERDPTGGGGDFGMPSRAARARLWDR